MFGRSSERADEEGADSLPRGAAPAKPAPQYRFYYASGRALGCEMSLLPPRYSCSVWKPRRLPMLPVGLSGVRLKQRFLFRWLLCRAHLFAGDDCGGALLIRDLKEVVHYSGFTPRYWRFPFVGDADFQIGDTWTAPAHRGRGLALFAVQTIVATANHRGRRFWYVVEDSNPPSIRVVQKAGFTLAGRGVWIKPWGLKLLGYHAPFESGPARISKSGSDGVGGVEQRPASS